MIVVLPGTPARDITTIDFSDITSVAIIGYPVVENLDAAIEFASDLDEWTTRRVVMRALSSATEQTIQDKAFKALTANNAFLALTSPTNAQALAQIQLLTKECNGLIRMVLGLYDATTGT